MPGRVTTATLLLGAVLLSAACSSTTSTSPAGTPCEADGFTVVDDFPGARRGKCVVHSDGSVDIYIEPEDEGPINHSPWYAFKLMPSKPGDATVTMHYAGFEHRYWPKLSKDRRRWQRLPAEAVQVDTEFAAPDPVTADEAPIVVRSIATLSVHLDNDAVLVSAQEIILPDDTNGWIDFHAEHGDVTVSLLGHSTEGRVIRRMDINQASDEVVLLTGRQHPPEVSGVFGMQGFYAAILADNELANAFRERFHIVAIPMLNPDGVVAGNWRHNTRGTDLNRDWGPFQQVETRLIGDLLDHFDANDKAVRIFVDFHSTASNVMYTHSDTEITSPPNFANDWVVASLPRLQDYEFSQEVRPLSEQANGRNYMYSRYGIPSVTFEVGDEQERQAARVAAGVFAEEMMRLLLAN